MTEPGALGQRLDGRAAEIPSEIPTAKDGRSHWSVAAVPLSAAVWLLPPWASLWWTPALLEESNEGALFSSAMVTVVEGRIAGRWRGASVGSDATQLRLFV